MTQQQLDRFFGMRVSIVREIEADSYGEFVKGFNQWLDQNPSFIELDPQLYIHRVNFDIYPNHFTVSGIDNRVRSLSVSVEINQKQREKGAMKFINDKFGSRLWPDVKHEFGEYKNTYRLEGRQLLGTTHFEEYLATVVLKRLSEGDRKVKFILSADATPAYASQTLKNVPLPAVTKFDFKLTRDVQLTLRFDNKTAGHHAARHP